MHSGSNLNVIDKFGETASPGCAFRFGAGRRFGRGFAMFCRSFIGVWPDVFWLVSGGCVRVVVCGVSLLVMGLSTNNIEQP